MKKELNLPADWGRTKYDDMTDEEFEAANPFGAPPPPGAPTDFSGFTEQDFAEMLKTATQQSVASDGRAPELVVVPLR